MSKVTQPGSREQGWSPGSLVVEFTPPPRQEVILGRPLLQRRCRSHSRKGAGAGKQPVTEVDGRLSGVSRSWGNRPQSPLIPPAGGGNWAAGRAVHQPPARPPTPGHPGIWSWCEHSRPIPRTLPANALLQRPALSREVRGAAGRGRRQLKGAGRTPLPSLPHPPPQVPGGPCESQGHVGCG